MSSVNIDKRDGAVCLPNGHVIPPSLSQDDFRQSTMFGSDRSQDCGTSPFIHYHFSGGMLEGREFLISLCFYDQTLLEVRLTSTLLGPDERDWSHCSLDAEAETKRFHEAILMKLFGAPTRILRVPDRGRSSDQSILYQRPRWFLRWGLVMSCYDSIGSCSAHIIVRHGDRLEKAILAYQSSHR